MRILKIARSFIVALARIAFAGLLIVGTFVMNCIGLILYAVTE